MRPLDRILSRAHAVLAGRVTPQPPQSSGHAGRLAADPGEYFEEVIERLYRSILRPGDIALDGGAHTGRHTFPLAEAVGSTGRVVAVEPLPTLAAALRERLEAAGTRHAVVLDAALGATSGRASFHAYTQEFPRSGLIPMPDISEKYGTGDIVQVNRIRLDDVAEVVGVRFMKLDLEGGEFDALRGGLATLRRDRPVLVFESARLPSAAAYGYSPDAWFALFRETGYELWDILGRQFSRATFDSDVVPWYLVGVPIGTPHEHTIPELMPRLAKLP